MATAVLAAISAVGTAASARATSITFDDGLVASGATLANQYASLGVTFAPGGGSITGVINPAGTTQGFATNVDMTIGPIEIGSAAPLSGLALRTYNGYNAENGDPVFTMTFSSPISLLSLDFGSVSTSAGQAAVFAVNPATGTAVTVGFEPSAANGTVTATGLPTGTRTIIVVPGTYNDYVAIDNLNFTVVPEPTTVAMSLFGAGVLGVMMVRRRHRIAA